MVVIEQMQRWRCPTYTPRTTVIAPYSSTAVVHALPEAEKFTLLFFRCAFQSSARILGRRLGSLLRAGWAKHRAVRLGCNEITTLQTCRRLSSLGCQGLPMFFVCACSCRAVPCGQAGQSRTVLSGWLATRTLSQGEIPQFLWQDDVVTVAKVVHACMHDGMYSWAPGSSRGGQASDQPNVAGRDVL